MTDLTEQWKKGELLEGEYYVRCDWSDDVEIRYVHNGKASCGLHFALIKVGGK